jgi:hypothetical protein
LTTQKKNGAAGKNDCDKRSGYEQKNRYSTQRGGLIL